MNRHQLEMNFDRSIGFKPVLPGRRRVTRARWWFAQMRQVVDRTRDREPTPPEGKQVRPPQSLVPVQN